MAITAGISMSLLRNKYQAAKAEEWLPTLLAGIFWSFFWLSRLTELLGEGEPSLSPPQLYFWLFGILSQFFYFDCGMDYVLHVERTSLRSPPSFRLLLRLVQWLWTLRVVFRWSVSWILACAQCFRLIVTLGWRLLCLVCHHLFPALLITFLAAVQLLMQILAYLVKEKEVTRHGGQRPSQGPPVTGCTSMTQNADCPPLVPAPSVELRPREARAMTPHAATRAGPVLDTKPLKTSSMKRHADASESVRSYRVKRERLEAGYAVTARRVRFQTSVAGPVAAKPLTVAPSPAPAPAPAPAPLSVAAQVPVEHAPLETSRSCVPVAGRGSGSAKTIERPRRGVRRCDLRRRQSASAWKRVLNGYVKKHVSHNKQTSRKQARLQKTSTRRGGALRWMAAQEEKEEELCVIVGPGVAQAEQEAGWVPAERQSGAKEEEPPVLECMEEEPPVLECMEVDEDTGAITASSVDDVVDELSFLSLKDEHEMTGIELTSSSATSTPSKFVKSLGLSDGSPSAQTPASPEVEMTDADNGHDGVDTPMTDDNEVVESGSLSGLFSSSIEVEMLDVRSREQPAAHEHGDVEMKDASTLGSVVKGSACAPPAQPRAVRPQNRASGAPLQNGIIPFALAKMSSPSTPAPAPSAPAVTSAQEPAIQPRKLASCASRRSKPTNHGLMAQRADARPDNNIKPPQDDAEVSSEEEGDYNAARDPNSKTLIFRGQRRTG